MIGGTVVIQDILNKSSSFLVEVFSNIQRLKSLSLGDLASGICAASSLQVESLWQSSRAIGKP